MLEVCLGAQDAWETLAPTPKLCKSPGERASLEPLKKTGIPGMELGADLRLLNRQALETEGTTSGWTELPTPAGMQARMCRKL